MKSINQISEEIAYELGDQFNMTLRESIKNSVVDYRAKLLRDDIDRNFVSLGLYGQTITMLFEPVNILHEFGEEANCVIDSNPGIEEQDKYTIFKSKKEIATPIRTKTTHLNPFSFVGTAVGREAAIYSTLDAYYYKREMKYFKNKIYYTYMNNHLYILNNLTIDDDNQFRTGDICRLIITGIFADPREAESICANEYIFPDDRPFPIGNDMLVIIKEFVKKQYVVKPKDGETVNIEPDKTDI